MKEVFFMKRLPKGFGSVQTLTGSRRKPYAVRIWQNETCRYKYIGYYATYQEALTALTEYNKNPYDANLANITVAELWEIFKERRFPVVSDSGKIVYTAAFKHLKSIHSVPYGRLKPILFKLLSIISHVAGKQKVMLFPCSISCSI